MPSIDQFIQKQIAKAHKVPQPIRRPPLAPTAVRCEACGTLQRDRGMRKACIKCGTSPLPSHEYSKDSCFHPDHK